MWIYLLACSTLVPEPAAEPQPSALPMPTEVDGLRYAAVVERPMRSPSWPDELPETQLLQQRTADLHGLLLSHPDHPWLVETLQRSQTATDQQTAQLLLQHEELCLVALEHREEWGLDASLFDGCPWTTRPMILDAIPEAAQREAWSMAQLPDDLATAFAEGLWLPHVLVRIQPSEARRIQTASERCARDASGLPTARYCVSAVAQLDWSEARTLSFVLDQDDPLRAALDRFTTGAALDQWLDEQGFPPAPPNPAGGNVFDRLRNRGVVFQPGSTPARFPLLLSRMGIDEPVVRVRRGAGAVYGELHTFVDGVRLRALVDLYRGADPEQLAAFANVVAARQGVDDRAMWVWTDTDEEVVVIGPPAALAALVDEGLVAVPEPTERTPIPRVPIEPDSADVLDTAQPTLFFD